MLEMILRITRYLLLIACAREVNGECGREQEYRLQLKMECLSKKEFLRISNENIYRLIVVTNGEASRKLVQGTQ